MVLITHVDNLEGQWKDVECLQTQWDNYLKIQKNIENYPQKNLFLSSI